MTVRRLEGRRILVVEDDWLIAIDLAGRFADAGAEIVGPAASIDDALAAIAAAPILHGAVVDLNLRGRMAYPVVDALAARGIPQVFTTGYDAGSIPERYGEIPRCEKPVDPTAVARALFG